MFIPHWMVTAVQDTRHATSGLETLSYMWHETIPDGRNTVSNSAHQFQDSGCNELSYD